MKKLALVYFIFFGLLTSVFGQTRNIVGRILSNEQQKPIKNANIVVEGSEISTVSNHLGFFALELNDEDVGPLIISHIGYTTSKVEIPEFDNFKISLSKEYIHIAEFDLAYYKERDLEMVDELDSLDTTNEVSASYPGGWEHFFNDLGRALLKTKFNEELGDDVILVQFKISNSGLIEDLNFEPYFNISDSIKEQFRTLEKWIPAKQFGAPTEQYFKLHLKWSKVFTIVEDPARPVGGMTAFYKHVGDNIQYPPKARRANKEGVVYVEFIIDTDGTITEVKSIKPIGGGLDEEAVRVILSSPKWIPGKKDGEPVKQRMVLPITFKLG
ncbi:MAG: TonB family protein [Cyclobacteriaceae bacterium]